MAAEPGFAGVADMVLAATSRYRDRLAFELDGPTVTYGRLGAMVRDAAGILAGLGLPAGAPVVQVTGNLVDAFALQMAAYLTGHPSVMLHGKVGDSDRAAVLDDAQPALVVVDPAVADDVDGWRVLSHGPSDWHADFWSQPRRDAVGRVTAGHDTARIAYTGGTTGRPKGVILSQQAMLAATLLATSEIEWPAATRFAVTTPITHAGGTLIPSVLQRGGTVVLRPRFDPEQFLADVRAGRANSAFLVPTMIYALLDELAGRDASATLELLLYGASPMSPARLDEAMGRFGPRLNQSYGQTEAPNTITILKADEHRPELFTSCGLPYAGVTVAIMDADGHALPAGETGEICVHGPQLMSGYLGRPEETAEALRGGWLWTGDRGYVDDDGHLFHVGRSKDVIISGGYNVYPSDVEAVLARHQDVAMCVVVGVPDDRWGEAVKAIVVRRAGAVTEDELRTLVRAAKGPIHVPKSFEFVDAVPLTALGKPDRARIRAELWDDRARMVN